ncbi:MAG: MBL fold metallo-hydrolase [Puniceicoccales bacterium]|nr:MBL fold metallo-hydrolase [Puniceicoccales bacterium]
MEMRNPVLLEDNAGDVVAKAQRGLGLDDATLAALSGLPETLVYAVKEGLLDPDALRQIAPVLELDIDALLGLACHAWPSVPAMPEEGFARFSTPFGQGLHVNNFLAWSPATREAAIFDTGTSPGALFTFIRERGIAPVRAIFITHAHHDHVAALGELVVATGAKVWLSAREPFPSAPVGICPFDAGASFPIGDLLVETLDVCGHSPGQTAFLITGLSRRVIVVGDALFAGSMGGCSGTYHEQRCNTAARILSQAPDTLIAPGHGPVTSPAIEWRHNPVFAKKAWHAFQLVREQAGA